MTSIGQTLAQARRDRKVTVKDVEKAIKIRAKYISALEKDDFAQISGDAYVVGFIKTYARWLDVDAESLIAQYRDEARFTANKAAVSGADFDDPRHAGMVTAVKVGIVVFVVLLLAAVLIILSAGGSR